MIIVLNRTNSIFSINVDYSFVSSNNIVVTCRNICYGTIIIVGIYSYILTDTSLFIIIKT